VSQQDKDALHVMELNEEVKWEKIHSKFKELVKKYHPDKNQGNKKFEDKLKKITLAYSQLKKTLGKK
jgi:curved DNA-binding protein CbpA